MADRVDAFPVDVDVAALPGGAGQQLAQAQPHVGVVGVRDAALRRQAAMDDPRQAGIEEVVAQKDVGRHARRRQMSNQARHRQEGLRAQAVSFQGAVGLAAQRRAEEQRDGRHAQLAQVDAVAGHAVGGRAGPGPQGGERGGGRAGADRGQRHGAAPARHRRDEVAQGRVLLDELDQPAVGQPVGQDHDYALDLAVRGLAAPHGGIERGRTGQGRAQQGGDRMWDVAQGKPSVGRVDQLVGPGGGRSQQAVGAEARFERVCGGLEGKGHGGYLVRIAANPSKHNPLIPEDKNEPNRQNAKDARQSISPQRAQRIQRKSKRQLLVFSAFSAPSAVDRSLRQDQV